MEQFYGFLIFTMILSAALFLPAVIELKKPKDSGPRKISGFETNVFLQVKKEPEPVEPSLSGNMISAILDFLPDMEV